MRRRQRRARLRAGLAAVVGCGLLATPSVAHAVPGTAPAPGVAAAPLPADPRSELDELQARAARLSREYRGQLVHLEDAEGAAEKAAKRVKRVDRRLERLRGHVAQLAASRYMNGGLDPTLTPFLSGDPDTVLDQAITAEQLAHNTRGRVAELQATLEEREQARQRAQQRLDEVRAEVQALEESRAKVERLMAKFQPQSPVIGGGYVTARMAQVRDEIDRRFGPFVAIGCYRPGGYGEHPQGRACDFMLTSGGAMPSAAQAQRGWVAANWAKANASRLGIMYIIYRQRIWDIRRGGGWRTMENRGGVTANHYDHPHVSVF